MEWQALYAATNTDRAKDRWTVDGVEWTRERHSYWGGSYSFQVEVHRLEHRLSSRVEWRLLVVIERWWDANRDKCVRDTYWCRALDGRADRIIAWMKRQHREPVRRAAAL